MAVGIVLGVIGTIIASIYLATATPTEGEITIESTPPGAEIQVDGATLRCRPTARLRHRWRFLRYCAWRIRGLSQ